jgi:NAD(P)H-hydrate epimerase
VLDAYALNLLSVHTNLFAKVKEGTIVTPHPKEFDRLFGIHENSRQRTATAIEQAKERKLVIVLKGHQTLVTNGSESFLNTTGNAGLAKGGSGDALTGIITALLAQGYNSFDAAKIGVYLHGTAADIALAKQSMESMLITDVIESIGDAFKAISK